MYIISIGQPYLSEGGEGKIKHNKKELKGNNKTAPFVTEDPIHLAHPSV